MRAALDMNILRNLNRFEMSPRIRKKMNFFAMKWIDTENSNLPKLIKFSKLCGQNIKKAKAQTHSKDRKSRCTYVLHTQYISIDMIITAKTGEMDASNQAELGVEWLEVGKGDF